MQQEIYSLEAISKVLLSRLGIKAQLIPMGKRSSLRIFDPELVETVIAVPLAADSTYEDYGDSSNLFGLRLHAELGDLEEPYEPEGMFSINSDKCIFGRLVQDHEDGISLSFTGDILIYGMNSSDHFIDYYSLWKSELKLLISSEPAEDAEQKNQKSKLNQEKVYEHLSQCLQNKGLQVHDVIIERDDVLSFSCDGIRCYLAHFPNATPHIYFGCSFGVDSPQEALSIAYPLHGRFEFVKVAAGQGDQDSFVVLGLAYPSSEILSQTQFEGLVFKWQEALRLIRNL